MIPSFVMMLICLGIYCKLIPGWIESTRAWISFPAQYITKFKILLGEVFQYTSNSKLGIWICIQARIDLNSQSKFYDILTLDHTKDFFQSNIPNNIIGIHSTFSFTRLWDFHEIIKQIYFPMHPSLTRYHRNDNTCAKFRISEMSVLELPCMISSTEEALYCLMKITKLIDELRESMHSYLNELRSHLNKAHERNQTMYNSMVAQLQNLKIQM